jgi:hypothetical protein
MLERLIRPLRDVPRPVLLLLLTLGAIVIASALLLVVTEVGDVAYASLAE